MKNIFILVLAIVLVSTITQGQTIKVTGGVNLMTINYAITTPNIDSPIDEPTDGPTDLSSKSGSSKQLASVNNLISTSSMPLNKSTQNDTGFYLGLALSDIALSETFELLPEIRFVAVKDFNHIQMPVVLKYDLVDNLSAVAGPNFSFLLDPAQSTKGFNLALDFGLSYNISDEFSIEGRYDWGQTNLLKNGDSNNYIKMNNIQFGIAYSFGK